MDNYQVKIHQLLNDKCYVLTEQNIVDFEEIWNNGDLNNLVLAFLLRPTTKRKAINIYNFK
jgi:hypothetical protein